MAKRKSSKNANNNKSYSVELIGLILILIGVTGIGFGYVGNFIKGFALFLAGEFWFLILFFLIYLGFYMLIKRKMPKFFSTKAIGIYLIVLIILGLAHYNMFETKTTVKQMVSVTIDNFQDRNATINSSTELLSSGDKQFVVGGGILGGTFLGLLLTAFGSTGALIVIFFIGIFALVLAFDINLSLILQKIISRIRTIKKDNVVPDEAKPKEYVLDGDELVGVKNELPLKEKIPMEKEDEQIVVATIDELKNDNLHAVDMKPSEQFDNDLEVFDTENIEPSDASSYTLPNINILTKVKANTSNQELAFVRSNQEILLRVLNDFDIKGCKIVQTYTGPAVTEYEITVPNGTKVNRITTINKEIALAMAAKDVRIQAPIPGKSTIGIEIPNREITPVSFREVLEKTQNEKLDNKIVVTLGKDIMGTCISCDLAKMPHLLVAGSTGSGKSVCINTIICSILMRYKPDTVKLVLVDPKKVELSNYNGIPHLLCPVVTDPKRANATLQKIVSEMENRYDLFSEKNVKNIAGYNEWVEKENKKNPESHLSKMPYFVIIIDELADLMLVASKEVQDSIMRITQMARAAGIHLIVATQRPSTDIITGVIKNNIPSRIAFAVSSSIDSRTILDQSGAEKLLGKGDMLYFPMGAASPTRVQGCFVSDDDIARIIHYCSGQAPAKYNEIFTSEDLHTSSSGSSNSEGDDDPMYNEIVDFAIQTGKISASLIQRRFRFGYNRAARMVDLLESRGVIGPANGSKPREVLVKKNSDDSPSTEDM